MWVWINPCVRKHFKILNNTINKWYFYNHLLQQVNCSFAKWIACGKVSSSVNFETVFSFKISITLWNSIYSCVLFPADRLFTSTHPCLKDAELKARGSNCSEANNRADRLPRRCRSVFWHANRKVLWPGEPGSVTTTQMVSHVLRSVMCSLALAQGSRITQSTGPELQG